MNPTWAFFSFNGRMRRRDYWLWNLVLAMILIPVLPTVLQNGNGDMISVLARLVFLVGVWASAAMNVKRLRDRNKSPWWILLTFMPVVGILFQLVELGILDGTPGPNRYGPDPKGRGGQPPREGGDRKDEAIFEG
ncbi:DUF805 domain-containing protein [Veronia pacifica]|uniref:DUF805 domain-containing protein n=1 Tax=Veronia pacifica TaxID=1080227 RepID=A0A1C3EE91_9GAMM|nr:DUF805 domain-containing protein [Veronia pacifica]ODA31572.1 hypothetical protein A8L45_16315 [Veronia pacifica]